MFSSRPFSSFKRDEMRKVSSPVLQRKPRAKIEKLAAYDGTLLNNKAGVYYYAAMIDVGASAGWLMVDVGGGKNE